MKYILMLILILNMAFLHGDCARADKTHNDPHIVRCSYTQEDIYAGFSQKPTLHTLEQQRKECFYCKCPINEHTKREVPEKYCANQGKKRGPFDEEVRTKIKEEEYRKARIRR